MAAVRLTACRPGGSTVPSDSNAYTFSSAGNKTITGCAGTVHLAVRGVSAGSYTIKWN